MVNDQALEQVDPPATTSSKLTRPYRHEMVGEAITALEGAIGGRRALVETLLQADPSTQDKQSALAYVMGMIADPRNERVPLAQLCQRGKITVGELLSAYRTGAHARMQISLILTAVKHIPKVVEDIYQRAQVHEQACPACQGISTVTDPRKPDAPPSPCQMCGATGKIQVFPDLDRQKLALEIAHLLPKKAPLIEANKTLNVGIGAGAGSYASLLSATDAILHPRRRVDEDEEGADGTTEAETESGAADGSLADPTDEDAIVDGELVDPIDPPDPPA